MFLAYLIFTEFEIPLRIVAVGHALRAFFLRRLVNKWVLWGKIRKDSFLLFICYFFYYFLGLDFLWSGIRG